ncbi:MAG TPA: SCO family protein [Rhizobiaceae bacterium]|nr:SCO family protein [Rhizobiaceae bacterium]
MMRWILVGILILMAAGVGWLSYDWYFAGKDQGAYGAPFTLVDQNGGEITEKAFQGHPSAVFFGFTNCPEICPTTLYEMDGWLKQLGDEGKDIGAYFVSIDPERDTPDVLKLYVTNVSSRIVGITGEPAKVQEMAKAFGIFFRKVETGGGEYTMDHTASVLLLDKKGDFAGTIAYGENPDTAVAKLKRLATEG